MLNKWLCKLHNSFSSHKHLIKSKWWWPTLATHFGHLQSPLGISCIGGMRQYVWYASSHPSHSNMWSSPSPLLHVWHMYASTCNKPNVKFQRYCDIIEPCLLFFWLGCYNSSPTTLSDLFHHTQFKCTYSNRQYSRMWCVYLWSSFAFSLLLLPSFRLQQLPLPLQ